MESLHHEFLNYANNFQMGFLSLKFCNADYKLPESVCLSTPEISKKQKPRIIEFMGLMEM